MIVLEYLVPLVSIVVTYVFGRLQSSVSSKKDSLRRRYESFYVPFIEHLYRGLAWELKPSSYSLGARSSFFEILFSNIQYLDESTQTLIPAYYGAYLDMLEWESGNPNFRDAPDKYDAAFRAIANSVLSESSKISKSLRLPEISKCASTMFYQSLTPSQIEPPKRHSVPIHTPK